MRTFLVWLVLACLLPAVIGALVLLAYQYSNSRAQQERDTTQTARALTQAVDNHLLRSLAVAQALSTADSLARRDLRRFHARAREAVALAGLGTNVVLRDEGGRQLINTALEFGAPLSVEAAPDQVRGVFTTGKPTISDAFIGPVLKQPVMSVDVPVVIGGTVVYALGVGILPQHFNTLLKAQALPPDWVAAVFDSTGTIIGRTHTPERFVGKKVVPKLLESIRRAPEGSIEATTQEGTPVLTFHSRSPTTRWGVVIGIPRQPIEGALARTLSLLAAGVTGLFGISLLLARLVGRKIAYSFEALTAPAAALGAGGAVIVPSVPVKEATEVASAISRAAALLEERTAILQAKEGELVEAHRLAKFGTWYWDRATGAITASESLAKIFGREVSSFAAMKGTVFPLASWKQLAAASQEALRTGLGYDLEIQAHQGNGEIIWINAKGEAVRNEKQAVLALRGTLQDITDRKRAEARLRESEEKLRKAALHDPLTGLPNRALVFEYCTHLLAAAERSHNRGALLFIDLDRFKPINDQYGHEVGDRVLQEVGRRLVACTRHEDLVGRLGGDEFVIILPYLDADRRRAAVVARHIVDSISRSFQINNLDLSISPSVGISYFPEHATDAGTLIHMADLAMYQVKQSGRANYQFYSPELDRRAEEAISVEARLKKALKHGGFQLHYQPVIDIGSGRLIGAEALVRLIDKDGETLGPDRFIPIAESAGLIGELGEWVAAEACRQQQTWRSQGLTVTMAINVSPLQFRQRAFADTLGSIIGDTRIDPASLEVEVTESAVMENLDEAVEILNRIKSLGVKIALDDFGTGYSSLSRLTSLPLDKLKVDQSFVRQIERDQASRAVTEAILSLGHSLQLDVHGEGIESEQTLLYLKEHGCNQAQGYWFSGPLPATEFAQWSREQARRKPRRKGPSAARA